MKTNLQQLLDAARVIPLTPHIRAYLVAHDPKAPEQLERAIAAAAATEPRFMYTNVADGPAGDAQFATLSEMRDANQDDGHYCEYLRNAKLGESYIAGGGATPMFVTWRVL